MLFRSNLGVLLHSKGRLPDAMSEYREALRIDRDYADAHYGMALTLTALGRTPDAIAEYREALRSRPNWPAVQRELEAALASPGHR